MSKRPVNITAWPDKADRLVTMCVSHHDMRSTVYLTEERARLLISELQSALELLPRTVTTADLGIEGAPV